MNLDLAARATLDHLVVGLGDAGYVDWLEKTYRKAGDAAARDLGRETRVWRDEDRNRILFEAVAYGSALLLENELHARLTRRKLLFGREPDRERVEAFRDSFLRYLPEKLRSMNLVRVEVLPDGSVGAHGVTGLERVKEYMRGAPGEKAYQHFGACMGRALDPNLAVITNIVALESIPMLVKVVRAALEKSLPSARP
jgi:hypothetical protein